MSDTGRALAAPALASRIEDAGLNASAPPEQLWLDGWLVRRSAGKAKRARSVQALAPGRLPLAERLSRAEALYREVGLPAVFRITPFSQPPELDAQLAALGMQRFDDSLVMAAALARLRPAPPLDAALSVEPAASDAFAEAVGALRGSDPAQRVAHAARLRASQVPYRGWLARTRAGDVVACGQFAREAELVGLYDVFTAPAWRRRGMARGLCVQLLRRAQSEGATVGYLQVDAGNAPARAVYRSLGFTEVYAYHYRAARADIDRELHRSGA